MLTMTNALTIDGFTIYQDDTNEVAAALAGIEDRPRPVADVDSDGNPIIVMRTPGHAGDGQQQRPRFYLLPETPTIAKDEHGKPIFSLIVYRQDEQRLEPGTATTEDVGGGILTMTVELSVPDDKFKSIRQKLRAVAFGPGADPSQDVDLTYVPFLDGRVTVAVAGEAGGEEGAEFTRTIVGTGKIAGVGENRRAVMVKLTQAGAALMSQIDKLTTLPINVAYELSFEHRLLGVTMRVWADVNSSYHLMQEVTHQTDDFSDGYLGMSENHVSIDKITHVTETLVRNKTAGVTVIPATSQIDNDTLAALEKSGVDMLNKQMEKMLEASPPPAELDRTYIEKYFSDFANSFNFSLDRRMVLVRNFTPSANVSNVFQEGDVKELVAFVDLRTAFFSFLKVPVRVNADFQRLQLDSVTVTVTYTRKRIDGSGREQARESFNFTNGQSISTFLAFANTLADVAYDWSATVHYKGSAEPYTINRTGVKDDFLVVDVGQLGMIAVDLGLDLVNFDKFPAARVSFRYQSSALGRTLERDFVLTEQSPNNTWIEVVHEEPSGGYEYKVDWLKADGTMLEGDWETSTSSQLRFVSPTPDRMEVAIVCTGNFSDKTDDQISQVAVSLRYRDPANNYEVDGHVVFTSEKQQQPWAVDLRNPALRTYQYRYTIIYTDGMVKSFPAADDQWFDGEPGFITVGEKYTLEVGIYPTLLTYPDNAKLVEVDLTYDDEANGIHRVGSYVFSKDPNQNVMKTWRVRGVEGGPTTYRYVIRYFSADGSITTTQEAEHEGETLVIPPAAAPAPAPVH
jgi:hypothetical protein